MAYRYLACRPEGFAVNRKDKSLGSLFSPKPRPRILRVVGQNGGGVAEYIRQVDSFLTNYLDIDILVKPSKFTCTKLITRGNYYSSFSLLSFSSLVRSFLKRPKPIFVHSHLRNAICFAGFFSGVLGIPMLLPFMGLSMLAWKRFGIKQLIGLLAFF